MDLMLRKRLSYLTIHFFMFLSGVEYAVIFPTIWEYLQSLGVSPDQTYWLGATLSAMTVTDMVSGLVIGRMLDLKCNPRLLVLILNCAQVLGSCLYLTASSPVILLVSRLVSGLGKGITIVFLTDICRSTEQAERTPILLLFNIAFQVGLLIGPACNLALSQLDLMTMVGHLDKLNSPGLLLAVAWGLFTIMVIMFYRNLVTLRDRIRIGGEMNDAYSTASNNQYQIVPGNDWDYEVVTDHDRLDNFDHDHDVSEDEEIPLPDINEYEIPISISPLYTQVEATYPCSLPVPGGISPSDISKFKSPSPSRFQTRLEDIQQLSSTSHHDYGSCTASYRKRSDSRVSRMSNKFLVEAERLMGESFTSASSETSQAFTESDVSELERTEPSSYRDYIEVLLREELVCLIYLRFVALFCQTCLESSVPPIMQEYFDYGDMANSILYLLAGVELIVVFSLLSIASKRVSDKRLISVGLLLMLVALSWLVATLPTFTPSTRSNLPYFAVGVVLDLAGIPTVCDIGLSLYSKLLPDSMQGLGHGVRRFISQLAIVLGPLWGAGTLHMPVVMLVVPLVLLLVGIVMFCASYGRMRPEDMSVLGSTITTATTSQGNTGQTAGTSLHIGVGGT
eukprot:GFUD01004190.1.p1 GENE.GFUD01004190.1~~GFUD01004190.1.p1  ORF type:complete len:678 (-),score=158.14 GFUD01004190.1:36-1901(-)